MKHLILFFSFAFCALATTDAQELINVQNGTKTEFYSSLDTAIFKAVDGDTLYLPGADIMVGNRFTVIDKKLFIIGAGHEADSTGGLKRTVIKWDDNNYGGLNFREGSSGSMITGCLFGDVFFGEETESGSKLMNIENVTIWRNRMFRLFLGDSASKDSGVRNITVKENIVDAIHGGHAYDCTVSNNLSWLGGISNLDSSMICNNVIVQFDNIGNNYSVHRNNFFLNAIGIVGLNNVFENNAFTGSDPELIRKTGDNTGNIFGIDTANTFAVYDARFPHNLTVKTTSLCHNAGTDGTDIGIFGGTNPYRAVPFNPHIDKVAIEDANGILTAEIHVSSDAGIVAVEYWLDERYGERQTNVSEPEQNFIFTLNGRIAGAKEIHFRFKDAGGLWSSVVSSKILSSVGAEKISRNGDITVFPNPVKDSLHVRSTSGTVSGYSLYNSSGTLLFRGSAGGNSIQIDMSGYQVGVYILRIETADGGSSVHRIIHN